MFLSTILERSMDALDKYSPRPRRYAFIMTEAEKRSFDKAIKNSRYYLEFGLGGSTLRALQKSKAEIVSVESSPAWIAQMREYRVIRKSQGKRLNIFPVDIGPTENWGYPDSQSESHLFASYSSSVFETNDTSRLDLVLVDGRFRVACTLKAIIECCRNENFSLLIHDFWNRPHYHRVLEYLRPVDRVDTLGHFSIKPDIDFAMLKKDYELYKCDPR